MSSRFYVAPLPPATYTISFDPVRSALLSLSLLGANTGPLEAEPWVQQATAALTPEQVRRNRLVFDRLAAAVLPDAEYPDVPTYLAALEATAPDALRDRVRSALRWDEAELDAETQALLDDPPALQSLVVGHLRELWEQVLGEPWAQQLARNAGLLTYIAARPLPSGTAADLIRAFIGRELPDSISAQLDGVHHVAFVLSPHVHLHAARFGSPTTIWVFVLAHFPSLALRAAPIKRGELLRPFLALADDTRLHILELLAERGELPTQDLIALLEQSQPNVSRHLKQLVAAGFVSEQRGEGANKRYRLNAEQFGATFWLLWRLLSPDNPRAAAPDARSDQPLALRRFLDADGRVTTWPARRQDQEAVLEYLVGKIATGREYAEREINAILVQWHTYGDPATLRRDLYDSRRLDRASDGSRYWRTTEEQDAA